MQALFCQKFPQTSASFRRNYSSWSQVEYWNILLLPWSNTWKSCPTSLVLATCRMFAPTVWSETVFIIRIGRIRSDIVSLRPIMSVLPWIVHCLPELFLNKFSHHCLKIASSFAYLRCEFCDGVSCLWDSWLLMWVLNHVLLWYCFLSSWWLIQRNRFPNSRLLKVMLNHWFGLLFRWCWSLLSPYWSIH